MAKWNPPSPYRRHQAEAPAVGLVRRCLLILSAVWIIAGNGVGSALADQNTVRRPAIDFSHVQLRIGVQDASAIGLPAETHGRSWAEARGAQVDVHRIPFGALYDRFLGAMTGSEPPFDVIFHAPAWAGDFAPYLREVPTWVAEDESFDDIHPTFRDRLMLWDDHWLSVTVDGDLFSGYYRRDLFDDPDHRQAFAARYGRELIPPTTWEHYHDIAEFFTGRTGADGQPIYGTSEAFARGGQQVWTLFARAAAYTNPPGVTGLQFFDPETMTPQINSPGWVWAMQEYRNILPFCPPEALTYGIASSRQAFIDGRTAMTLDWGDTGPLAEDTTRSQVADKVGYFVLPGSDKVWDLRAQAWKALPNVRRVPFLAFGGWVAAVPQNAPHPDAAWDYIMWFASVRNSLHDVLDGRTGVNPYRYSHFLEIDAWMRVFPPRAAADYLRVIRSSLDSPHAALDLRLPGFNEYVEALEDQLPHILTGEIGVQPGLDLVAKTWNAITDRRGREKQQILYRTSMGLPPIPP